MRRRSLFYVAIFAMILGLAGLGARLIVLRNEERRLAHVREIVAALRIDLSSGDIHRKADAARAIYKLGPLAKDAVPELVDAFKKAVEGIPPEWRTETGIQHFGLSYGHFVRALWAIGEPAKAALLTLLDDKERAVRLATVYGLNRRQTFLIKWAQQHDALAVKALRKALRDQDSIVRLHACNELGDFEQFAKDILPDLLELQEKDPDEQVRAVAAIGAQMMKQ